MRLRVHIDHADFFSLFGERGGEVGGGGRLPNASLLIHERNDPHAMRASLLN
jgi:hypothetical protein